MTEAAGMQYAQSRSSTDSCLVDLAISRHAREDCGWRLRNSSSPSDQCASSHCMLCLGISLFCYAPMRLWRRRIACRATGTRPCRTPPGTASRGWADIQRQHSRQPEVQRLPRRHQGVSAPGPDCAGRVQDLPRGPGVGARGQRACRLRRTIPAPVATAMRTRFFPRPIRGRRSIR